MYRGKEKLIKNGISIEPAAQFLLGLECKPE